MEGIKLGISYYANRIPWRVKEDLEAIREAGCNTIVHTFNEEDHEFYQPAMEEIVEESRRQGLEVWLDPWAVGQVFGGETYSSLVMKKLSLRQISSRGDSLPIVCPNQPGFREYLLEWIETAARFGPDVLFWDEPHFHIFPEPAADSMPKLWACCCAECRSRFEKRFGHPMPEQMTPEVRSFKEESMLDFIRFLCDSTKARGLRSALCLLPYENSSTLQDWTQAAAIPSLDIIGTDPYWRPHQPVVDKFVGRWSRKVADLAKQFQKEGQIWILNFNIPKGEEETIRIAIEAAYQEGIRNFAAWSYFGASYISLRSEDPAAVWKTLSDCYRSLQERSKDGS